MIHFILMLFGFSFPNSSTNTTSINQIPMTTQSSISLTENLDTGGETTQTPPKK
ncbi:hypothetical protein [Chryseobacterium sp. SIMBA_028]|uniref:hypothetical protein n=1 Tax=Chryseobacterium sp. SIMBA_028 TaxID=3085771 RepID=UPI00397D7217